MQQLLVQYHFGRCTKQAGLPGLGTGSSASFSDSFVFFVSFVVRHFYASVTLAFDQLSFVTHSL